MANPLNAVAFPRGALVAISTTGAKRSISFQYNPDTVRRTIEPNVVGGQPGMRSRAVRFAGAPAETLTIDCRFSAMDGIDAGDPQTLQEGIAPQLAALAMLVYPSTADVQAAQGQLADGVVDVIPPLADRLLFVFGSGRVVPCQVQAFSIVEELYDEHLSPVLATVSLTLRAISYSDVNAQNPSFHEFITYQQGLEQLAGQAYDRGGSGQ
jgi:uncharacterized membrane protein SirB2